MLSVGHSISGRKSTAARPSRRSGSDARHDHRPGLQGAVNRALSSNLDRLRPDLFTGRSREGDPPLEPINLPTATLDTLRAIFGMNLGVAHLDRERGQLPALALGI